MAVCEDADWFDGDSRTCMGTQHTYSHTNITSDSIGTVLKICLKTRVSLILREMSKPKLSIFFMLEKTLCKYIHGDPDPCIKCQKIVVPGLH